MWGFAHVFGVFLYLKIGKPQDYNKLLKCTCENDCMIFFIKRKKLFSVEIKEGRKDNGTKCYSEEQVDNNVLASSSFS